MEDPPGPERRTRLANERTYLAWLRSGLTALAVSIAAGRLVPELTGGEEWPYVLLGVGYALLGLAFVVYALVRLRTVERELMRGGFAAVDERVAFALTGLGVVLAVATLLVVVFAR